MMGLLFGGCPIHEGEIIVEKVCIPCTYYTGGSFFSTLAWCNHPKITERKLGLKELSKKLKTSEDLIMATRLENIENFLKNIKDILPLHTYKFTLLFNKANDSFKKLKKIIGY